MIETTGNLEEISFEPAKSSIALHQVFQTAIHKNLPLALWKLPNDSFQNLIIDFSGASNINKPDLDSLGQGFLISPFAENQKKFFLNADLHYQIPINDMDQLILQENLKSNKRLLQDDFLKEAQQINNSKVIDYFTLPETNISTPTDKSKFIHLVENGVNGIQNNLFQKVVLSRSKSSKLPPNFNLIETFNKVCLTYPNAFVSLVSLPEVGTWLGASPEILVHIDKDSNFKTVALAGTQAKDLYPNLKEVAWRQKEIEEQAMVSRYIINCFKKIRLREFEEIGPRTVAAGNLVHLRTDFSVNIKQANFPHLGTVMLELLHPTSAVCGMPKKPAVDFILEHEHYNRMLYSGYLGPVNISKQSHIFVNLRCMQLQKEQSIAYAGAGITADSNPEKEWEETNIKMDTLLKVVNT